MGSFPLINNSFCCYKNIPNKKQKVDINLNEKKEYLNEESESQDNQKFLNHGSRLEISKKNFNAKQVYNLNNNKLDDSDQIIHLRAKYGKKKNKHKRLANSSKIMLKRSHTMKRRKSLRKILNKRIKRNIKKMKSLKKTNLDSNKNDDSDLKEISLKIINNEKFNVMNNNEDIEKLNNIKKINEKEFNEANKEEIKNSIINNNIINNININIADDKIINNGININVDLNNDNNNEIIYKKGKTNVNANKSKNYLKKEAEEGGNNVYIKIVSEKSIDYSHGNFGRSKKSIIYNRINSKFNPQDIKINTMESYMKETMDNLNHPKTVNYNKLKKNSSSNNSFENLTIKTKKSYYNKTEKNSVKYAKNNYNMTCTGNNSSESPESDDSSETRIILFEKLEKDEEEFIKNTLKKNKLLTQDLDDDAIDQFVMGFYCVEFQKGQILYNKGNEAKIYYIIYTGKVLIYNEDNDDKNKLEKNEKKTKIYKINNFVLEDTSPFSILHPKTIDERNNELNLYVNLKNNYIDQKKSHTLIGNNSLNSFKGNLELTEGHCFGQECFEENGFRNQNAKILEKAKIFCCSGEFYRNAKNYMRLKVAKERKEVLLKLPIFKYIDERKLLSMSKKLKESNYNYCSIIINENEMNNTIYVVKEGEVRITRKFKKITSLQKYSYFGHINLIIKKQNLYTYSIESKKAILYEIPYSFFVDININELIYKIFIHAIKTSIGIKQLFIHNYKYFYKIFKLKYYLDGEIVYKKNLDENKKLCVIIAGVLKQEKTNKIEAKEEEVFGDNIIDSREDLESEIISSGESLIFEASWKNIVSSCEIDKNNNLDIFETVRNLKRVKILNNIHEIKMLELAKVVHKENYNDNTLISKEGELANKFYIVKKGKIKLYQKTKFVRELDAGGFFGEIPGVTGVVKLFTAFAVGETECYVIYKKNFSILEEPSIVESIKDCGFLDDLNIELSDLFIVKSLGKGKFGKVYLVHNQKHFYAIKSALISEIIKSEKLWYYIKEKEIMKMLDFPFVLRFVKTLKTTHYIFFLEENIEGISLRKYLSNRKKENNKNIHETEFYGAILLLVLNYIHHKKIIHRDIKPDNCMIDQKGYLKVIDFGISKYLKDQDLTNTICGTPHYMAPEIISGKGYSYSADYWSFGVTLFEIFYDYLPFGQGAREILDIYQQILGKKLILPYDPKFNQFNSFLKIILAKNIMHRVCNFKLLKSHPFFQDFHFEQLLNHSNKPPFIPQIENNLKNLSVCNTSVLDYFQSDAKDDINNLEKSEEFLKVKQLLDDF